jgi:hypothetical protein
MKTFCSLKKKKPDFSDQLMDSSIYLASFSQVIPLSLA